MPLLRFAPLVLLLLPLVEIALFVGIGGAIGVGGTILCVLATAVLGLGLLRRQGIDNLRRAQAALGRGETPLAEMLDGMLLAVAGMLLFLPGFLTDAIGVCLFLPPVRRWAIRRLAARMRARRPWRDGGAPTIETEYHIKGETRE